MSVIRKRPMLFIISLMLLNLSPLQAQDFTWAPDYPTGATIPVLEALDQNGQVQTLASLTGEKGLLLAFNRSFDWCGYCKAQLESLTQVHDEFTALGVNIATITYDPVATLKQAEEDFGVEFSLLHDADIKHVNAFGILNTDYSPGEFGYGIPQPGLLLIDPQGVIRYKFAEEDFRERPDWSEVLRAAGRM